VWEGWHREVSPYPDQHGDDDGDPSHRFGLTSSPGERAKSSGRRGRRDVPTRREAEKTFS
jgi:hypothetical protein